MDDKHVQEKGGVLPAPPPRIPFLTWSLNLCPDISSPEVCSAWAGFTSLENFGQSNKN